MAGTAPSSLLPRCSRSMPPQRFALPSEVPGLAARRIAADILDGVLHKRRTLDEQLDGGAAHPGLKTLSDRDRALMRRLVATILRRLGTLGHVLSRLLDRGIPTDAPRAQSALLIGAAQILWMDVPDHAAVDLSVRLVQSDRRAAKYAGLVNAVLRRCAREGQPLIDEVKSETLDLPPWLLARWIAHYGEAAARDIAIAIGHEPSLDITVKSDAAQWATRLHGETLPTGSVRTLLQGSVTMLPGFAEGQWWVQDAAAALPARLFGDIAGKTIADLCAAPGGKTAQLAQAGARVIAVDRSPGRMTRLRDNLARLSLAAEQRGGRRRRVAGRKHRRRVRRHTGRRSLLLDRHHPASPRCRLAAAGSRYRRADGACRSGCCTRPSHCSGRAGRWSTAPVRWSRKKASRPSPHFSPPNQRCAARRSMPARSRASPRS